LDESYVSQTEFNRLYNLVLETGRLMSGFMKYWQQPELRGPKCKGATGAGKL